jgi:hypothetical protein
MSISRRSITYHAVPKRIEFAPHVAESLTERGPLLASRSAQMHTTNSLHRLQHLRIASRSVKHSYKWKSFRTSIDVRTMLCSNKIEQVVFHLASSTLTRNTQPHIACEQLTIDKDSRSMFEQGTCLPCSFGMASAWAKRHVCTMLVFGDALARGSKDRVVSLEGERASPFRDELWDVFGGFVLCSGGL